MSDITWKDFEKIQIRVGTVVGVEHFPEARKPAYKIRIDFGPELGVRKSSAQITDVYGHMDLLGKQVVAVVNFPPKQIANFQSECLVLGVVGDAQGVVLLQPERKVPNGSRIL